MRTIRTTTISILALGLLGGSVIGVAAQDEEAAAGMPTGASYFTGQLSGDAEVVAEPEENVVDGVLQGRGLVVEGDAVEVSDPRLNGTLSAALNASIQQVGDFETVIFSTTAWRIENDDGAWTGQGTALEHVGAQLTDEEETVLSTVVLTGEDAYEGLTAYVLVDWTGDPVTLEGAVFTGEAPPFPAVASAEASE